MAAKKPAAKPAAKSRNIAKEFDALVAALSARFGVSQEVLKGEPEPVEPPQSGQEEAA